MIVLYGLLALLLIIHYYFTRTFSYWKNRKIVYQKPVPFFGNLKNAATRKENLTVTYKGVYDAFPQEKIVGFFRMTTPCLMIRDLEVIKHILLKDFDSFEDRGIEFSDEGLGTNLFHANAETWRVLRNKFTPLFTTTKLKNMMHLMTERCDLFMKHLRDTSQTEHEIHLLCQRYTMSTIAACAFGIDIDMVNDSFIDNINKIDKLIFTKNFFYEVDMMYPGILKKLNLSLFPAEITNFFQDLVKKVMNERTNSISNRRDFIDLILDLKNTETLSSKSRNGEKELRLDLTDDIIAAQAFVFYAAGYETSATTLAYLFYELAKNQDIQQKLVKEIDDVINEQNGELKYEAISSMQYLKQVFDETLRKYPLVELQRRAKVNYRVPDTNIIIEKGQTIIISSLGIHYDEKYYPNPEKFDPERFSPENSANRHPCAYIPFGVGPRNCIGMRFAKLQSYICAVKLLKQYRVEISRNTKNVTYDPRRIVMSPKDGIILNLIPRR
ncbi:cytochrome P450 6B1-like [Aricia agestis]|uniref:cytochrome P450 6B1-like n=1 Tax=Aricia agestis TaxID=91739 RepID=UPI001C2085C9|nr:cytochrome P450 6B1-like [Aricia agestis]